VKKLPKGLSITPTPTQTVARLYNTNIVVIDHKLDGVTLNTGGWSTKHTKKCMNIVLEPLGYHVYQKAYQWYIYDRKKDITTNYADGISIY
jgi:hypothetical protein